MNRVHLIRSRDAHAAKTYCGKVGWGTRVPDEFDTAECNRFEAVERIKQVDCNACRRAYGTATQ